MHFRERTWLKSWAGVRFVYLFDSSSSKPETPLMDFRYRSQFRMRVIGRRVSGLVKRIMLFNVGMTSFHWDNFEMETFKVFQKFHVLSVDIKFFHQSLLNECYNRPFSNCIVLSKRDCIKMNFTWNHLHTHGLRLSGILEYFYFTEWLFTVNCQ